MVEAGEGWSTITTERRVLALDDWTRRGMGSYWRLVVPGSGLLRRQWLEGIKKRAQSVDGQRFLLNAAADENIRPFTLILNWDAELEKK